MDFGPVTPILRFFDEAKMREFYIDYLGFRLDWEHRFEPETPLYAQVSRGRCILHLSEHHGDGTPGTTIRIPTDDLDGYHAELTAKRYKYYRPGIQEQPWGRDMTVQDGSGNKLTFFAKTPVA
jgi:catechol 2,3-dioxygenase-like lactoylglutathione lyase family enzyme